MKKTDVVRRDIPNVAVPRLALYLRKLRELESHGRAQISSHDFAVEVGVNAAQIRKDLSYLGEFGTRGVGYEIDCLVAEIERGLGLDREWTFIIVGAGLLGTALARYRGFATQGFRLTGMFDVSSEAVGVDYGGGLVRHLSELRDLIAHEHVDIAMVTVPAEAAQEIVDLLHEAGVGAILNFAPVRVQTPEGTVVRQVDLSSELASLTHVLSRNGSGA